MASGPGSDLGASRRFVTYAVRYNASLWRGVAQFGSALASGARGPEFKSRRPDHFSFAIQLQTLATLRTKTQPKDSGPHQPHWGHRVAMP